MRVKNGIGRTDTLLKAAVDAVIGHVRRLIDEPEARPLLFDLAFVFRRIEQFVDPHHDRGPGQRPAHVGLGEQGAFGVGQGEHHVGHRADPGQSGRDQ